MYKDLLTCDRIRLSTRGVKGIAEEVESDRARVLYSASFRRLQRKTQVFPLEDNASVRTRLTHSLEVAHVGRYLASSVIEESRKHGLQAEWGLLDAEMQHAFTVITEVACLLHDIGNPPFGHFGEFAIAEWFKDRDDDLFKDFLGFDGNPQGFRIISRLNGADGATGMNLTLSQLASTIKYPSVPNERKRFKKFGVFQTEQEVVQKIRARFGLAVEQRFPLAYLMEAADDISYCLSDIEDGVEKRIIRHGDLVEALKLATSTDGPVSALIHEAEGAALRAESVDQAVTFRSYLIRLLVGHAARCYVEQHDKILSGEVEELITRSSPEGRLLEAIKAVVRKHIYTDSSIQSLELAGMAVITGLLQSFGRLLEVSRKDFNTLMRGERVRGLDVERRLLDFMAGRHVAVYKVMSAEASDIEEAWLRAHLCVDYISGMTDPYALEMHQMLSGSRL